MIVQKHLLLLAAVLWFFSAQCFAQQDGSITIQSARLAETNNAWLLSTNADIRLSPEIRQGLDSGVPLQFIVELRIKRQRNLWPDQTLLAISRRYSLIYYVLTRHYRLELIGVESTGLDSIGSGPRNYRSLLAALDELGSLQAVPITRPASFDDSGKLIGHLSFRLDDKALPLPLQSLLPSAWKLASEDYAWSLN